MGWDLLWVQKNADSQCIAVVAHFEFTGPWKTLADEINWSYKDAFNKEPEVLRKMQEQFGLFVIDPEVLEREGIYLEQCLCYVNRAQYPEGDGVPPTFYFIFTFREPKGPDGSKRHTLRDWQYVDADGTQRKIIVGAEGKSPREMLLAGSVDNVALAALAKRVAGIFTEPYTRLRREKGRVLEANCTCSESGCCGVHAAYPKVLSEACPILAESVSIFDFSTRECLKESSVVGSDGALFLPVGDALQEPFWPEGLGINRGIHNALDACWAANKWALAAPSERDDVLAEREYLYNYFTAPLSGKNRKDLKPESADLVYFADPESRYCRFQDRALHEYTAQARAVRQQQQRVVRERSRSPRRGSQ